MLKIDEQSIYTKIFWFSEKIKDEKRWITKKE